MGTERDNKRWSLVRKYLQGAHQEVAECLRWRPGDQLFGLYEIEALKSGGMAVVAICKTLRTGIRIALKIPRISVGELYAEGGKRRIADELVAWRRIRYHRNVLPLSDVRELHWLGLWPFGDSNCTLRLPALLIAYGGPHNLAEYVQDHPQLSHRDRLSLVIQVALGMQHAAACGVTPHLDLKPLNVMVDEEGTARVTDFGLAQVQTRERHLPVTAANNSMTQLVHTAAGQVCGTQAYMAPEQWHGIDHCDQRTDIYAFGILACHVLADFYPYHRPLSYWVSMQHVHETAEPDLTKLAAHPALRDVVLRCLHKSAGGRFQNWDELLAALPDDPIAAKQGDGDARHGGSTRMRLRTAVFLNAWDEVLAITARPPPTPNEEAEFRAARIEALLELHHPWRAFFAITRAWIQRQPVPLRLLDRAGDDLWGMKHVTNSIGGWLAAALGHSLFTALIMVATMAIVPLMWLTSIPVKYFLLHVGGFSEAKADVAAGFSAITVTILTAIVVMRYYLSHIRCPNCRTRLARPTCVGRRARWPVAEPLGVCPRCSFHSIRLDDHFTNDFVTSLQLRRLQQNVVPYAYMSMLCRWCWPGAAVKLISFGLPFRSSTRCDHQLSVFGWGRRFRDWARDLALDARIARARSLPLRYPHLALACCLASFVPVLGLLLSIVGAAAIILHRGRRSDAILATLGIAIGFISTLVGFVWAI